MSRDTTKAGDLTKVFEGVGKISIQKFSESGLSHGDILELINTAGGGLLRRQIGDVLHYANNGDLRVLVRGEELVGCFALEPLGEWKGEGIWEISAVAIKNGDERFRGKGIGSWIAEVFGNL